MILGMSIQTFTILHVVISLIAIASGIIVVIGMFGSQPQPRWTALFLATTVLTSLTGFLYQTLEGIFGDPMHGGNANLVGWKLIGYPGPRLSYRDEIEKHYGQAFRLPPMSLQQIIGRKGRPIEEETD